MGSYISTLSDTSINSRRGNVSGNQKNRTISGNQKNRTVSGNQKNRTISGNPKKIKSTNANANNHNINGFINNIS
jgi:hypothetical protein